MLSTNKEMLLEFHRMFSEVINPYPCVPDEETRKLRVELIREEYEEFKKASEECNILGVADAIADLLYVVHGSAVSWGVPADALLKEVHRSNMTKVWDDGMVHKRADGKVLKPQTYSKPDILGVLARTVNEYIFGSL